MRTKTTLLCAAALAAGIASSWAQSNVYSLNIVGYVNQTLPYGFSFVSNPLQEDSSGNLATNAYPDNAGNGYPLDGCQLQFWTGVNWSAVTIDASDYPATGYANAGDSAQVPTPTLPQGKGYLFYNTVAPLTNTYVGTVVQANTNSAVLTYGFSAVGSAIPLAGGIGSVLGLTNAPAATGPNAGGGVYDGCQIQTANYNGQGFITGFTATTYDSGSGTGFDTASGNPGAPEPQIALAQGFFFYNTVGASQVPAWVQTLNP